MNSSRRCKVLLYVFTSLSKLCKNAGPIGGRLLIATHQGDQSNYVANETAGDGVKICCAFQQAKAGAKMLGQNQYFADGGKPACFDFCSSKFTLQGHILSTGEEREWNGYGR
jgi:hypothetical protein